MLLWLQQRVCNICNPGFKASRSALRCHFSAFSPSFVFSLMFVPVLLQIMVTLSWLAGTPFRGQSPWVRTTCACMHIWAREHMGSYANTDISHTPTLHIHTHTRQGKPDAYTNTHTSTHFQSPPTSCLPTLHLINPCVSLTKQERALSSLWTLKPVA